MDLSQPPLISQCEDDCSLTHEQFNDVAPLEIDLKNGMLGISFLLSIYVTYLRVNVIIHSWVLYKIFIRHDIDGNEIVVEQLKDSVDNCSSKFNLIEEVEIVKEPKNGMIFNSIEELHAYYQSYAKQEGFSVVQKKKKTDKNGYTHYITLGCARQGSRPSGVRLL
jgi:hypothetical protein